MHEALRNCGRPSFYEQRAYPHSYLGYKQNLEKPMNDRFGGLLIIRTVELRQDLLSPIENGDSNIEERLLAALQPVQAIAFDSSGLPAAISPIWSRLTPAVSMRKNQVTTAPSTELTIRP